MYAGTLEGHGLRELKDYAEKFMDNLKYDTRRLETLYEVFRHKLAHLCYPYPVFNTATKKNRFHNQPVQRVTWTVYASKRKEPIEVIDFPTPQYVERSLRPWDVWYNCRTCISLPMLRGDIIKSIYGASGYLRALEGDPKLRENFAKCMRVYFPP